MGRLVAEGPPKVCTVCGNKKERAEFYAYRRDGRLYAAPRCIECETARVIAVQRKYRAKTRARGVANWKRTVADPERHAIFLDKKREAKRKRLGIRLPPPVVEHPTNKTLPLEPFRDWMIAIQEIGEPLHRTMLGERHIRRILQRKYDGVSIDLVDLAFLNVNRQVELYGRVITTMDDLYPLDEAELEEAA